MIVLVTNESRNNEIWLVRKGEWPAVQLTDYGSVVALSTKSATKAVSSFVALRFSLAHG
jgi:hypothetical protein